METVAPGNMVPPLHNLFSFTKTCKEKKNPVLFFFLFPKGFASTSLTYF